MDNLYCNRFGALFFPLSVFAELALVVCAHTSTHRRESECGNRIRSMESGAAAGASKLEEALNYHVPIVPESYYEIFQSQPSSIKCSSGAVTSKTAQWADGSNELASAEGVVFVKSFDLRNLESDQQARSKFVDEIINH